MFNTKTGYAASIRLRLRRADTNGTPPINMANCVASIVTCDGCDPLYAAFLRGISLVCWVERVGVTG
jgi:hypothetical protein